MEEGDEKWRRGETRKERKNEEKDEVSVCLSCVKGMSVVC